MNLLVSFIISTMVAVGVAEDPVKVEVFFSKEHVPADLKAGEKVDLKQVVSSKITGDGSLRYTTSMLAPNIEVVSVTKEEKPKEPWLAISVILLVSKEQAKEIERAKSTMVPFTGKDANGKRVTKQRPVPMRIERGKP
ncbi:MAG: hypothetical protein QM703_25590 [Gemmatales bacterium]